MCSRTKDNPIVSPTITSEGASWIILGVTISIGAPLLEESGMISGHTVTGVATIVIGSEDSATVNHSRRCGWWIALTSSTWQHGNLLIFQGKSFDSSKVMDDALFLAWSWLTAKEKDFNISFNQWSSNISNSFG